MKTMIQTVIQQFFLTNNINPNLSLLLQEEFDNTLNSPNGETNLNSLSMDTLQYVVNIVQHLNDTANANNDIIATTKVQINSRKVGQLMLEITISDDNKSVLLTKTINLLDENIKEKFKLETLAKSLTKVIKAKIESIQPYKVSLTNWGAKLVAIHYNVEENRKVALIKIPLVSLLKEQCGNFIRNNDELPHHFNGSIAMDLIIKYSKFFQEHPDTTISIEIPIKNDVDVGGENWIDNLTNFNKFIINDIEDVLKFIEFLSGNTYFDKDEILKHLNNYADFFTMLSDIFCKIECNGNVDVAVSKLLEKELKEILKSKISNDFFNTGTQLSSDMVGITIGNFNTVINKRAKLFGLDKSNFTEWVLEHLIDTLTYTNIQMEILKLMFNDVRFVENQGIVFKVTQKSNKLFKNDDFNTVLSQLSPDWFALWQIK